MPGTKRGCCYFLHVNKHEGENNKNKTNSRVCCLYIVLKTLSGQFTI